MKDIELKLLSELLKNSRRSDRDLAKAIGTSQPTVTRTRRRLEKEGIIREYTMIPDFLKLGYALMSVTFVTLKRGLGPKETQKAREAGKNTLEDIPSPVIMSERGRGLGYDGSMIALHRSYSDYLDSISRIENLPFIEEGRANSYLINLEDKFHYLPLTLSLLAKHVATLKDKREKK